MTVTIVMIVRLHNLFAVVMLGGIYSLLAASIFVVFDAVDVAFTEAAVGAGISTVLLLGALALTTREERVPERSSSVPLIIVLIVYFALKMRRGMTKIDDIFNKENIENMKQIQSDIRKRLDENKTNKKNDN